MSSDDTIQLLIDLMRRPSVTPDDRGCQALISERLIRTGFQCEAMNLGSVSNLWARYGDQAPVLCFAGHTDVVPPGDLEQWRSDPFEPEIHDDYIYGRGAADMKSGVAAMVVAAESFVQQHPNFNGSISLLLTSDEEGEAVDGTRHVVDRLISRGDAIDWCIIGEPSSSIALGDVIRIGRRGSLTGDIVVRGVQGHVAYPEQVENPVTAFAPVLQVLCERQWDKGDDHFPPTSFQVVILKSGIGASNVTPPDLRARFNFRFSPVWSANDLRAEVESIVASQDIDATIEWTLQGQPFLTPPGTLIDAATEVIRDLAGIETRQSTGGGTSDGRFIAPTGAAVVELGPVNETIHKIDERVRIVDV
ncbi:MAG: succinyl-diaminopimelate desuccinylase, partial [Woeseiaceae bacterium]|nr:succinyl-diaminopimelate desuccinylase [Woeseiaceae bacterium]